MDASAKVRTVYEVFRIVTKWFARLRKHFVSSYCRSIIQFPEKCIRDRGHFVIRMNHYNLSSKWFVHKFTEVLLAIWRFLMSAEWGSDFLRPFVVMVSRVFQPSLFFSNENVITSWAWRYNKEPHQCPHDMRAGSKLIFLLVYFRNDDPILADRGLGLARRNQWIIIACKYVLLDIHCALIICVYICVSMPSR